MDIHAGEQPCSGRVAAELLHRIAVAEGLGIGHEILWLHAGGTSGWPVVQGKSVISTQLEGVRFARDSPLEGDGFELLVPPRRNSPRARHVVWARLHQLGEA